MPRPGYELVPPARGWGRGGGGRVLKWAQRLTLPPGFMTPEQEQAYIELARGGDVDAFNMLVESRQRQAFNLAARLLGDRALAEDATQNAFMSAYRGLRQFRGGSFQAWLLRIVVNACRDMQRRRYRRPSVSLDDETLGVGAGLQSTGESPEEHALRRELQQEIQRGLETLAEDQKLALVLVDIQGLGYQEAADALGANLGTVKSRLSRARAALRDYLRRRPELLPGELRLE